MIMRACIPVVVAAAWLMSTEALPAVHTASGTTGHKFIQTLLSEEEVADTTTMLHDQAKAAAHAQARAATHEQGKATAHEQEKAATHAQAKAATHAQGKATTHEQENVATLEQGKAATHAQAKAATQEQAKAATHEQAKAAAVEHETHASSQHAQEKAATVQREGTGLRQRGQEMVSMELTGQAQEGDKKDEKEWVVPLAVGIAVLVLVGAAISAAIWFRRDIIPPTDAWKEHVAELEKKGIYWDKKEECFVKRTTSDTTTEIDPDASILNIPREDDLIL